MTCRPDRPSCWRQPPPAPPRIYCNGDSRKRDFNLPLISWFEGALHAFHNSSDSKGAGAAPAGRERVVRRGSPRTGEEARSAQKTLAAEGLAKRKARAQA